jgi:hypothetical protein
MSCPWLLATRPTAGFGAKATAGMQTGIARSPPTAVVSLPIGVVPPSRRGFHPRHESAGDILSLIARLRARRLRQHDGGCGCGHATADGAGASAAEAQLKLLAPGGGQRSSWTISRTPLQARATHSDGPSRVRRVKSGEYCRIRGRTYCLGATFRQASGGIPGKSLSWIIPL